MQFSNISGNGVQISSWH